MLFSYWEFPFLETSLKVWLKEKPEALVTLCR